MIYIGADHAGFELKEKIKKHLEKSGLRFVDVGGRGKKDDDYPDFALKVARKVSRGGKGILICGSGVGVCISANKVKGIRAVQVYDRYTAVQSRKHGDSNVICFRGRRAGVSKQIRLLDLWLKTEFSGEKRHKRRIKKVG
jgi:ribose 5-phosphate isomerase B